MITFAKFLPMAELNASRLEPPVEKNLSCIPVTRRIVGQRQSSFSTQLQGMAFPNPDLSCGSCFIKRVPLVQSAVISSGPVPSAFF